MCAAMLAEKAGAPSPGFPVAATLLQRLQWAKKNRRAGRRFLWL